MAGFFEDDNGNKSSMRLLSFIVVIFGILCTSYILTIWGYIALKTTTFPKLDFSDLFSLFGSVLAVGFKAVQKKFERDDCGNIEFKRTPLEKLE